MDTAVDISPCLTTFLLDVSVSSKTVSFVLELRIKVGNSKMELVWGMSLLLCQVAITY